MTSHAQLSLSLPPLPALAPFTRLFEDGKSKREACRTRQATVSIGSDPRSCESRSFVSNDNIIIIGDDPDPSPTAQFVPVVFLWRIRV